jgi:hypothetical protein
LKGSTGIGPGKPYELPQIAFMRVGTTSENASMYWSQVPLKLLSKNR